MAFLIDMLEEGKVTDFTDIRAAFSKYKTAKDSYWHDLNLRAFALCRGFEAHLGLSGQKYTLPGKPAEPYCQPGTIESGQFKAVVGPDFVGEDLKVEFAIKLVVDEGPNEFPKKAVVVKLKMGKTRDGYLVELLSVDGAMRFSLSRDFTDSEKKGLYEAIALEVIDSMDASIFD